MKVVPAVKSLFALCGLLFIVSCSEQGLALFFDIPQPTPEERAEEARIQAEAKAMAEAKVAKMMAGGTLDGQSGTTGETAAAAEVEEEERPEIEKAATWKQAKGFFPMDREGRKGRPDWTEAVRQGIIRPRESVDGVKKPARFIFKYDFFIPTEEPGFEAYFPHSTHTEWIDCASCHPKIFPVRGAKMTKKEMKKGKYCGVCHRKKNGTAFWLKACDRCHLLAKD